MGNPGGRPMFIIISRSLLNFVLFKRESTVHVKPYAHNANQSYISYRCLQMHTSVLRSSGGYAPPGGHLPHGASLRGFTPTGQSDK